MLPYADAQFRFDLHHDRVAELARRAAEHRLAREGSQGRHRRTGRWPRRRAAEAPATAVTAPA